MLVRDVMTPDCRHCDADDSLAKIAAMMAEGDIGCVPVGRGDRLEGIVSDRDIVVRGLAKGGDISTLRASDVMSAPVHYCFDDRDCAEVAAQMAASQIRRMPVVDREKRLKGIVSLGDLARGGATRESARAEEGIVRPADAA